MRIDNQAAIRVSETHDFSKKMKHIETRFYFLSDHVVSGSVQLSHIPGVDNPADLFTKAVKLPVFRRLSPSVVS